MFSMASFSFAQLSTSYYVRESTLLASAVVGSSDRTMNRVNRMLNIRFFIASLPFSVLLFYLNRRSPVWYFYSSMSRCSFFSARCSRFFTVSCSMPRSAAISRAV